MTVAIHCSYVVILIMMTSLNLHIPLKSQKKFWKNMEELLDTNIVYSQMLMSWWNLLMNFLRVLSPQQPLDTSLTAH